MLGSNAVKAVHTATFYHSIGTLLRRSTFSSLIPIPSILDHPKSTQQKLLKVSLSALENSYINSRTTINSDPLLIQRSPKDISIPLPFIRDAASNNICPTIKMQQHSVATLNKGIKYGLNPNFYFASTKDVIGTTTLPDLFCQLGLNDRTEEETYECMNRNARRGKRANKGKRACSRQLRRKRRRRFGNHRR